MAYFDNASSHPISVHSATALHRYVDLGRARGRGAVVAGLGTAARPSKGPICPTHQRRPRRNRLCAQHGGIGEQYTHGLRDHLTGGNVVISDLNFSPCISNYKFREQQGLDVRIVKNLNWQIDMAAMADAVDGNTRLISVALVSNVNGFVADVAALSKLAHDNGAYLYVDIMQAAGGVPIDVKAMGIDFAACSTFKWLMGVKGFGVSVRAL